MAAGGMALANGDWLRIPQGAHVPDVTAVLSRERLASFKGDYKDNPKTVDALATEYAQPLYVIRAWAMQLGLVKVHAGNGRQPGKVCEGCGEWKPLPDFIRQHRAKDGYTHKCKVCLHPAHVRAGQVLSVRAAEARSAAASADAAATTPTAPAADHPFAFLYTFFALLPATTEALAAWGKEDFELWVEALVASAHMLYGRGHGGGGGGAAEG